MSSPFEDFANAIIVFEVASSSISSDSFGFPVFPKTSLTCSVHLKSKKDISEARQGSDKFTSEVEGYWVDPIARPSVPANTKGRINVGGMIGTITLMPSVPNPFIAKLEIEGLDPLKGVILWD